MDYSTFVNYGLPILALLGFFWFVIWNNKRTESEQEPVRQPTPAELLELAEKRERVYGLEAMLLSLYNDYSESEAAEHGVTVHRLWLEGRNIFIDRNS